MEKDISKPAYVTLEQYLALDQRVTLVEQRLTGIEERLARVEGRLEELSKRIDNINDSLSKRIDDLKNDLRWFMGIAVGSIWGSMIITILLKILGVI